MKQQPTIFFDSLGEAMAFADTPEYNDQVLMYKGYYTGTYKLYTPPDREGFEKIPVDEIFDVLLVKYASDTLEYEDLMKQRYQSIPGHVLLLNTSVFGNAWMKKADRTIWENI